MKKQIKNMAEDILQEYTNCYSEVDQECLEKMLFKLALEVKADTVQEMQERVKAQKFTHKNFGDLVYVEDIDQIAKEMLEGKI